MLDLFFSLVVFTFGLVVGSFLSCVIYRLALPSFSLKNLGGLKGRSYCPQCKKVLSWQDLIPIFSFLILKGKCRYCKKPISWQDPLVEIATGILFLLTFTFIRQIDGYPIPIMLNWALVSFLIIIFVYDLKHYIIPDEVIYPAIVIALIYNLLKSDFHWKSDFLISAFGAAAFFLFIVLVSRGRWMGVGDIKLAFLMGLILGFPNILVALFLAFFMGAIIGIGLIIFSKKTLKSEVPFGPFLVAGTFIALFFGAQITNWYLNFLTI